MAVLPISSLASIVYYNQASILAHTVDAIEFQNDVFGVLFSNSIGCVVRNCIFVGGDKGIEFIAGKGNRATINVMSELVNGLYSSGSDYFDSNYADSWSGVGITALSGTKLRFNTTTNCATGVSAFSISEFANDQ